MEEVLSMIAESQLSIDAIINVGANKSRLIRHSIELFTQISPMNTEGIGHGRHPQYGVIISDKMPPMGDFVEVETLLF